MARFILETDDPSRRIIRLTDHPSKYKHKTNYPDELRKKIVRLVTRVCINAGKQTIIRQDELREQIRLNRRTTQIVRLD